MMNVSLPFYKPFLYLLVLMMPVVLAAQIDRHEVVMNDSISIEIISAGITTQVQSSPNYGTYFLNGVENATIGGPENELLYIPDLNYIGNDTMSILYYEPGPVSSQLTFLTIIFEVKRATVYAVNDFVVTDVGTAISIDVLSNDLGSSSEFLSITEIPLVNDGTVELINNELVYTPDAEFVGTGKFTYTVCDIEGDVCDVATVAVFVQDNLGQNDTTLIATLKNQSVRGLFPVNNGVLEVSSPKNGKITSTEGGVTYTPDPNFVGRDTFTYAYNINDQTSLVTFTVDVIYSDDDNDFAVEDFGYTLPGDSIIVDVLANDLSNILQILTFDGQSSRLGTVEHLGSGIFKYTPPAWLIDGLDYFDYKVTIPGTTSEETTRVYILVNSHLPAKEEYELFSVINTPLVINYDIPISNFSFTEISAPDNGNVVIYNGPSSDHSDLNDINGQAVIGNNVVVYYPNPGFKGIDEFELEYCAGGNCKTITIYPEIRSMDLEEDIEETLCVDDCVWVGDTNKDGAVDMTDLLPIGYAIGSVGTERLDAANAWYGQGAEEWEDNIATTEKNLKHVDTDGDGVISYMDTIAVKEFYGKTNGLTSGANIATSQVPLFFVPRTPNPAPGDLVEIDVYLGTENFPATNIHGITFALNFNEDIVEPGSMRVDYDQDNWLAYGNAVMSMTKEPRLGRVESGYTRTTGRAAHGYGKIGKVSFIVVDEILDGVRLRDTLTRTFHPQSTVSMGIGGQYVELTTEQFELKIAHDLNDPLENNNQDLIVYPNPTSDILNIHINGNNELEQILVRSITGQEVMTISGLSGKQARIGFDSSVSNGIYLITAICDRGVYSQKIKLVR